MGMSLNSSAFRPRAKMATTLFPESNERAMYLTAQHFQLSLYLVIPCERADDLKR